MNFNWFWKLLFYAVGASFALPPNGGGGGGGSSSSADVYPCSKCTKTFCTRSGRSKHVRRVHENSSRYSCRHDCGKFYTSAENCSFHERNCEKNPHMIQHGAGVPQQHHRNTPRGSQLTMRLMRSSVENNFRHYRRSLSNTTENIFAQLRQVVMHDVRGVVRRERKNIKFYVSG